MFNKILLFLLGGKGWKDPRVTELALGKTAPTRTVLGFRGPPREHADLRVEGSKAGPKTIPGGGPGTALEPRDAVPPLADARAAGSLTMFAAADFETRNLAAKSGKRPPHNSRTRRASARQTRQLEPLKGRTARVPARLRLRALRSALRCCATVSSAPPGQAPPRRPSGLQTAGNLAQELESGERVDPPRPKERPLLPGEGRAKGAPGRMALS